MPSASWPVVMKWFACYGYILVCCAILLAPFCSVVTAAEEKQSGMVLSRDEALRVGERIYREGILSSGKPLEGVVKGDIPVEGHMFSCQSCHMRAGLGSFEGGVYSPPVNGNTLFRPLKFVYKGIVQEQVPPRRPAYSDATLAEVIRFGNDPGGRIINDVMPRYQLDDQEMASLIAYLKSLSSHFSPGVTETTLRFATIVTDEVGEKERAAMLAPLESYVRNKNTLADYFETQAGFKSRRMAVAMLGGAEPALRKLSLTCWLLKGAPKTWRSQLEEYYRKEPVFALIGGITTGEWRPIHQFSEENQIPCLFPDTDYPVISKSDWYTLYLSKGYYQEGEGAARYLNGRRELHEGSGVVQIVRESREGQALAAGFLETWRELGHEAPLTVRLKAGEAVPKGVMDKLTAKGRPAVLLLWDDSDALPVLGQFAAAHDRPEMVFVSSTYLGKKMTSMDDASRAFTYITYPYRLPEEIAPLPAAPQMARKVFKADPTRGENQSYAVTQLLNMVFMNIRGNYYRDYLLDLIDCIMDQEVPLYERLSFGPGQRYASKGCYIVQLAKGETPRLIRRSDWVMH